METTTLTIEGMSCGHCERTVAEALKAVPGVSDARVRLESGTAVVEHDDVDGAALERAVSDAGYAGRCVAP